jgi:predicted TPR repeat methyltransferase
MALSNPAKIPRGAPIVVFVLLVLAAVFFVYQLAGPRQVDVYLRAGDRAVEMGRIEEARLFYGRVLAADPGHEQAAARLNALRNKPAPEQTPTPSAQCDAPD